MEAMVLEDTRPIEDRPLKKSRSSQAETPQRGNRPQGSGLWRVSH